MFPCDLSNPQCRDSKLLSKLKVKTVPQTVCSLKCDSIEESLSLITFYRSGTYDEAILEEGKCRYG
jgi:hypothetical protein